MWIITNQLEIKGNVSTQKFKLPIYYIHQIAEQLGGMGVDTHSWLKKSQLKAGQLSDVSQTLTFATFRQLVLDAVSMAQEPALGLLVGGRLLMNTHGILGYAAMNSSSLRQAVELLERYSLLRTPLISIRHSIHDQQFRLIFDEPYLLGDIRLPVLETVVLAVKNMLDYITMGSNHVSHVMFAFPAPEYAALTEEMFKCEVKFGQQWTGFVVPVDVIDLALTMNDPVTFLEASMICQRELEKISQDESLAMRVRRVMLRASNGFPSLNITARLFHMTPRTLHRYLIDDGTSYRAIVEDVRHVLAVEHLKSSALNINEIAYILGYTDIANFRRAFKRWEGIAPSEYRTKISATSASKRIEKQPIDTF
ncbi:ornithine utilization transcriptional regulator OruR [soil metagenome]